MTLFNDKDRIMVQLRIGFCLVASFAFIVFHMCTAMCLLS